MIKDTAVQILLEHFSEGMVRTIVDAIAEDEREECAKICEELRDDWFRGLGRYEFMGEGADYCVDAIRARGQE